MLARARLVSSHVCLALGWALPEPCLVTCPVSVPLIPPANGREVRDVKVLQEWSRAVVLWAAPGQCLPARCAEPGFSHRAEAVQAREESGEGMREASLLLA